MRVDVVIPVRNGAQFIERVIASVRAQSLKVNNIIIVNDGSTDSTEKIVRNQPGFGLDLILINNKATGLSNARNTGISFSEAEYVALLDCDDQWTKEKLFNQVSHLESHSNCRFVFSNYSIIQEGVGIEVEGSKNSIYKCTFENVLMQRFRVLGSASSALIERKLFQEVGLFDENLKYGEDYDLWTRMSRHTYFCEIPSSDVIISIRSDSMQNQTEVGLQKFKNSLMYIQVWNKNEFNISDRNQSQKLLWPDIRKSLLSNPREIFIFEKHIRIMFKDIYKQVYRNRLLFAYSLIYKSLIDLRDFFTRQLRKG